MHLLDAPALLHELDRQPVEQFRMTSAARPSCRSYPASARCRGRNDDARCDSRSRARSADCPATPAIPPAPGAGPRCAASTGGSVTGGLPYVTTLMKPGCICGPLLFGIAANQQIRWRRLVASRPGVQKTSFDRFPLDALSRRRLVAGTIGRETVIAVGDARRHRNRLGTFLLDARDLRIQLVLRGQIFRLS